MTVTKGSTWIGMCDPDIEETMDRTTAVDLAIIALDDQQVKHEKNGKYELSGACHNARQILERIRDEINDS